MTNLKAFLGAPTSFETICQIYSPTINDIVLDDNYSLYQKILTTSQEEIYDSLHKDAQEEAPQFTVSLEVNKDFTPKPLKTKEKVSQVPSPLEYILTNCYHSKLFLELTQNAFLLFTHCEILPLYDMKSIYVGPLEEISKYKDIKELPLLNNDNFLDFQNAIRKVLGMDVAEKPDPNEDPRITRMKAKARYRDAIKAKSGQGVGLSNMLVAICCMGIGITPLNIGELSYSAAIALFSMYQNKEKYDLDTKSLLAGADPKKIKPKYWITN